MAVAGRVGGLCLNDAHREFRPGGGRRKVLAWYRIYTAGAPRSRGSARLTAGALALRSPRILTARRAFCLIPSLLSVMPPVDVSRGRPAARPHPCGGGRRATT